MNDRIKAATDAVSHVGEEYSENLEKIKEERREEERAKEIKEKAQDYIDKVSNSAEETAAKLAENVAHVEKSLHMNKEGDKDSGKGGKKEREGDENSHSQNDHSDMGVIDPTGPEDPADIEIAPDTMA
eukprot:CAMPEP_0185032180 /NCGR_PEP_ID=MMETSP1103-20130426/20089_1 /TAXON_ID=36769 /ORGANISM="Paraphysomonas bandaiensis, Strain Caron Lab Isolate" /LENGTH=127 /DNA_ID=CAMNT_0027567979 /DNA_START=142 /DNA_END=525 /DNA_ORIENTATION=-